MACASCLGHAGRHDRFRPGHLQPALRTLPPSNAPHPAPSIHVSREANHLMVAVRQIPLARPYLDGREEELVLDVLRSGDLALGPVYRRFEEAFADIAGTAYAVACSSGTAGLHASLARLGVGPGDEVITSSFSFVASANVILFQHATPVFADIDEQTFNVDPAAVEAAITPRTKAILPVHIFGYPCDIGAINAIARASRPAGGRGRLRGAGRERGRPAGGRLRQPRRLRLLPEQADHHRRGWHDHDRRRRRRAGATQHRQPGALGQRRLAGAPAARVQLQDG